MTEAESTRDCTGPCGQTKPVSDFKRGKHVCKSCAEEIKAQEIANAKRIFTSQDPVFKKRCRVCGKPDGEYIRKNDRTYCNSVCDTVVSKFSRNGVKLKKLDLDNDSFCVGCNCLITLANWALGYPYCQSCAVNEATSHQEGAQKRAHKPIVTEDGMYECINDGCNNLTSLTKQKMYKSRCSPCHHRRSTKSGESSAAPIQCKNCPNKFFPDIATHRNLCKPCRKEHDAKLRKDRADNCIIVDRHESDIIRWCIGCGIAITLSNAVSRKDGLTLTYRPHCRSCHNKASAPSQKKYRENNLEKVREASRKSNRNSLKNKPRERTVLSKAAHVKDIYASILRKDETLIDQDDKKVRAKISELVALPCSYCGFSSSDEKKGYGGIDRVDSSQGYILSNMAPCCGICNKIKSNLSVDNFKDYASRVAGEFQDHSLITRGLVNSPSLNRRRVVPDNVVSELLDESNNVCYYCTGRASTAIYLNLSPDSSCTEAVAICHKCSLLLSDLQPAELISQCQCISRTQEGEAIDYSSAKIREGGELEFIWITNKETSVDWCSKYPSRMERALRIPNFCQRLKDCQDIPGLDVRFVKATKDNRARLHKLADEKPDVELLTKGVDRSGYRERKGKKSAPVTSTPSDDNVIRVPAASAPLEGVLHECRICHLHRDIREFDLRSSVCKSCSLNGHRICPICLVDLPKSEFGNADGPCISCQDIDPRDPQRAIDARKETSCSCGRPFDERSFRYFNTPRGVSFAYKCKVCS